MGIEIKISYELASIAVTITEFTSIVKKLTGEIKDEKFRSSLGEMIEEVRRSFDIAVDIFTPFYEIDTQRKFSLNFAKKRANFKNRYLKDKKAVKFSCRRVTKKLNKLKERKAWKSKLPLLRRSFKRLEDLSIAWIANDEILAYRMNSLLTSINAFLNDIARIKEKGSKEAYEMLKDGLNNFEGSFSAVKDQLEELSDVSEEL